MSEYLNLREAARHGDQRACVELSRRLFTATLGVERNYGLGLACLQEQLALLLAFVRARTIAWTAHVAGPAGLADAELVYRETTFRIDRPIRLVAGSIACTGNRTERWCWWS